MSDARFQAYLQTILQHYIDMIDSWVYSQTQIKLTS